MLHREGDDKVTATTQARKGRDRMLDRPFGMRDSAEKVQESRKSMFPVFLRPRTHAMSQKREVSWSTVRESSPTQGPGSYAFRGVFSFPSGVSSSRVSTITLMCGEETLSHLHHPHVEMQKQEAVLRKVLLPTPDTTIKQLREATTSNIVLGVSKTTLSNISVPEAMWSEIAQNALKSAFVLETSEHCLPMANKNYQYNKSAASYSS